MSRTCMYCGCELAKGESCGCSQSVRMRKERQNNNQDKTEKTNAYSKSADSAGDRYAKTSYTPPKAKKTWKERYEEKRKARPVRNRAYKASGTGGAREFFGYLLSCIKNPVFKASNPGYIKTWWIYALVGIQGLVVSSALFLSNSVLKRGLFGILSMALGFKGIEGWKNFLQLLVYSVSGTAMGYIQFFVMCAIFFLVGKLTMRSTARFRDYMERFVPCTVPLTVVGLLGVVLAVFSPSTIMILLACGAVFEVILMYESLRACWHAKPDFMVYTIVGGLFMYAVLCYNFYKILI